MVLEACNDNGYIVIMEPREGELKVQLAVMAIRCPSKPTISNWKKKESRW